MESLVPVICRARVSLTVVRIVELRIVEFAVNHGWPVIVPSVIDYRASSFL